MKLYFAPATRGVRPRWLLEEIGVPYDLVRLDMKAGEHRGEAYKKIHPHGAVPALVDGPVHLFESAAIVMYIADKFPEHRMAPALDAPERGFYYQWMFYAMATIEPALLQFAIATRGPEAKRSPAAAEEARVRYDEILGVLDRALADRPFLLGEHFSAADVLVGSTLGWAAMMGLQPGAHAHVAAYLAKIISRPAFERART